MKKIEMTKDDLVKFAEKCIDLYERHSYIVDKGTEYEFVELDRDWFFDDVKDWLKHLETLKNTENE
jgi:hypothetical protein